MSSQDELSSSGADIVLAFGRGHDTANIGRHDDPNYASWTVRQLRRECSDRHLKPPQNLRKWGLVQLLQDHDRTAPDILRWLGHQPSPGAMPNAPRRTPHCAFRLCNLLFSDEFSSEFAATGDTLHRGELDNPRANRRITFWQRIADAFKTEREDCRTLIAQDTMFDRIDPAQIVNHEAMKLRAMWKEINQGYRASDAAFRQSGTHDADFRNFVRGRADVLYLWHWLQIKPQLNDFVNGGMLEQDQFDSLSGEPAVIVVAPKGNRQKSTAPPRLVETRSGDEPPSRQYPVVQGLDASSVEQTVADATRASPLSPPSRAITMGADNTPQGQNLTPRTRRQYKKGRTADTIRIMAKTAAAYMAHRQASTINHPNAHSNGERAAAFQLLDNLRTRILEIQKQIDDADSQVTRDRLEEDLQLYLHERERVMGNLRSS